MATYQLPFTGDTIKSELQQLVNNEFTNVMSQTSSPAPLADNDEIPTTGWVQDEIGSQLANKVDKVTGKGLSTNDYTNADKTNVDKIPSLLTEIQPVERGGTGATSAAGARNNLLGGTGIEERTLLWTNASPTSNFLAQTISLDLSEYDAVEIISRGSIISTNDFRTITKIKKDTQGFIVAQTNLLIRRSANITNNGIVFGDGSKYATYNDFAFSVENSWIIPFMIYGIKEV